MSQQTDVWQLLPALTDEEYAALKADIAARGVMVPVEYDEHGAILDGHHRVRACRELGITDWPRVVRDGLDDESKAEHVLALNLDRRHLSRDQRYEVIRTLQARGWSLKRIVSHMRVGWSTIYQAIDDHPKSPSPNGDRVEGADGKTYPATQSKASSPMTVKKGVRSRKPLPDFAERAGWDMHKRVEAIQRIFADDRYPAHEQKVAAQLRGHLLFTVEVCQDLLDRLPDITGD